MLVGKPGEVDPEGGSRGQPRVKQVDREVAGDATVAEPLPQ